MTSTNNCINDGKCPNGTKINVKVNPNISYDFYVIDDNTTALILIMDRNLGNKVAWINESDYATENNKDETPDTCDTTSCNDEGPITTLNELKRITSTWTNIPEYEYTYIDDGGGNQYPTFTEKMRARLLTVTEAESLGCQWAQYTCPDYLYTNLVDSTSEYSANSYWLSTARDNNDAWAWYINHLGYAHDNHQVSFTRSVRPVITISK